MTPPPAASTAALAFDRVHHAYGGKIALRGVSLAIAPGEVIALLGPSGCGKTTLLRIAAGLERPVAGTVAMDGRLLAADGVMVPPERRGIGLMFQDHALFPHLDVAANVAFGLSRRSSGEVSTIVADLLGRVGLADRGRAYPHMLSGGEQQRVALARAMAPHPAILLMDEPFSNLDQRLRRGMREETIRLLRAGGAAAMMVTHDPDDAMAVADRIAVMRAGRIVQVGTPEEVYRAPIDRWVATLFADLEEVSASVRGGRAETPLGSFAAPGLADGAALVCIRRDAFDLETEEPEFVARVLSTRFLGEHRTVTLAIDGLDRPIAAHVDARRPVEVGARIGVGLDRAEVFVFADESRIVDLPLLPNSERVGI